MKKNPWVAAVLNFLLFGGGTLYVGRRMLPGLVITVGGTVAQVAEIDLSPLATNSAPAVPDRRARHLEDRTRRRRLS